ncbi:MAG: hypothetical protein ACPGLV_17790, partial [Bacteroidia bacterium]
METAPVQQDLSLAKTRDIIEAIKNKKEFASAYKKANVIYLNGATQLLSTGGKYFEAAVDDEFKDHHISFDYEDGLTTNCTCKSTEWCSHKIAGLLHVGEYLSTHAFDAQPTGKTYTRDGMIKRVMDERRNKALKAEYKMSFADNKYGEHLLINEKGNRYKITLRDFENETGYCNCPDHKTNKLGTCKHLMFAFGKITKKLKKQKHDYPFIEIYLDSLNAYQISWHYNGQVPENERAIIERHFGQENRLIEEKTIQFLDFIKETEENKLFKIRSEVLAKIEDAFDLKLLNKLQDEATLDYSSINATLYPYQKQGVEFAT